MREAFATQLPNETLATPAGRYDSSFNPQANIIVPGNGGAKIIKLVYGVENLFAICNVEFDQPHVTFVDNPDPYQQICVHYHGVQWLEVCNAHIKIIVTKYLLTATRN